MSRKSRSSVLGIPAGDCGEENRECRSTDARWSLLQNIRGNFATTRRLVVGEVKSLRNRQIGSHIATIIQNTILTFLSLFRSSSWRKAVRIFRCVMAWLVRLASLASSNTKIAVVQDSKVKKKR